MNSKKNKNCFAVSFTSLVLLLTAGCGSNNSGTTTSVQPQTQAVPTFSYTLSETRNGETCSYQSPAYQTLNEYCSALEDSDLNRDCGLPEREQLFETSCTGNFNQRNGRGDGHPPAPQPEPPRPQPPTRGGCTIRNNIDGLGHTVFEVVGKNNEMLGSFQTSEQADAFAQDDARCRNDRR